MEDCEDGVMKFKAMQNLDGHDWSICWTGQDEDLNHWNVTTNYVQASELYHYSKGAQSDAELIAKLLDWYHKDPEIAEQVMGYGF